MKLKSFRAATKHLSDETDLVMQKRVLGKWIILAPIIDLRVTKAPKTDITRIVLVNDKEMPSLTLTISGGEYIESKHPF